MGVKLITSSAAPDRLRHARAWLETQPPAAEILILAATADAENVTVDMLGRAREWAEHKSTGGISSPDRHRPRLTCGDRLEHRDWPRSRYLPRDGHAR